MSSNPGSTYINNISFIQAADLIGNRLCKKAFWHNSRCNWVGMSTEDGEPDTPVNRALGADIYDGTSGIALFLSYLYMLTKNEGYHTTALGAILHSLYRINDITSERCFGFYCGKIGIAYAAVKIGTMIKNQKLTEHALEILTQISKGAAEDHLMDVISGNAGAIPALLEMYDELHEEKIYNLVISLGRELLASSVKEPVGCSWGNNANSMGPTYHNLTGFAHGAAGIGHGLLELFRRTDIKDFLQGAEKAFQYENQWFDQQKDNWRDFRILENVNDRGDRFATAWCHGAPGIGLSRLRAYDVLRKEEYLKDSKAAIRTAIQLAQQKYGNYNGSNYSLCHGLTGICELLIYASQIFNSNPYRSLSLEVGLQGIAKHALSNTPWPCGAPFGEPPGLMLGLAGIGYFYLRLHDPIKVPSVLIVLPK